MPALQFLEFDFSDDTEGVGVFDAMASVNASAWPALQQEIATLLNWAHTHFPSGPGNLEDGAEWSYELSGSVETSSDLGLRYDAAGQRFLTHPGPATAVRHAVNLTLSGNDAFCDALRTQWLWDGEG
jgi:hypothetical protein